LGVTVDLGVTGPMRVEGSQSRHHHHPTQLMTGLLEHACAKYALCSLWGALLNHNTRTLHMDI